MRALVLVASVLVFLSAAAAADAAVTVLYDPGTTQVTQGLTGFATDGDMMDGMTVTALYIDQSFETAYWHDTGFESGGAFGSRFSLVEAGDTFGAGWTLASAYGLVGLLIDAGTGNAVFDITWDDGLMDFGTDGSARGSTFQLQSAYGGNITATYVDMVALDGSLPVGDLYRILNLLFSTPLFGSVTYIADTDSLEFAGDIRPAVPEPGTMILLGSGLAALEGYRRRRMKRRG